ncbi:hypothetical protein PRUPE_I003700 [Prunus persica]|uniref:Mediator complex subunit 15 KIX domain-containing protein n=2 Tax=Prunus persica TaxID=3760 RepID=A0A1R3L4V5_PRUPE|nr:hypothetical protein PRUPE_I003700 [Prunus persica]
MNLQGSVATMPQSNMTSLQQSSMSALSGVSTAQQNMMNSLPPSSSMDSGQGNALNSLQQVPVGSNQQTPVSAPQQANMNALSSQSGVNMLQANMNSIQSNSGMLQHQHLKQQQEHQMFQNQLKQQFQHRQMQQQLMQKQQLLQHQQQQLQQLQLQAEQQLPAQLQAHQQQMPQLHQMNDVNDLKMRQGMGVKPGVFQQHLSVDSWFVMQTGFLVIKLMKEMYLPESEKIATKLLQQLDKLKMFRTMLERLISVLQISKSSISPGLKDKLFFHEKQIVNFINAYEASFCKASMDSTAAPPT